MISLVNLREMNIFFYTLHCTLVTFVDSYFKLFKNGSLGVGNTWIANLLLAGLIHRCRETHFNSLNEFF